MDRSCKQFEDGLTILAEGGQSPETTLHLESCPACTAKVLELRKVIEAARLSYTVAPRDLIARAQALMQPVRNRLLARLLGSSLANAGARAATTERFSLHLGADDLSVRVSYAPAKDGWEVAGRAPGEGWEVEYRGERSPCGPAGRFRLNVPNLEDAEFLLRGPWIELEIPSASEFLGRA